VATLSSASLVAGSHSVTTTYNGDSNYSASSTALWQTIVKAVPTIAVSSSPNASALGQAVTFTATVGPSGATGTVTFLDGITVLGRGTLSNGVATLSSSTLTAGSHSITAAYYGDSNYGGSTSATLVQTVTQPTGTSLTSNPNPSISGQLVTFTATIVFSAATGTVTFFDGSTLLGSGTLSKSVASFATSTLAAGWHNITATYSGDSNYGGSTSATLVQTVTQPTTTTLISSLNPSVLGQMVTFTATVSPCGLNGTVTFKDGTTTLASSTLYSSSCTLASSGQVQWSENVLSVGAHSITATYSGESYYGGSTSDVLTQTVNAH